MSVTNHYNGVSPVNYLHDEPSDPGGVLCFTPKGSELLDTASSKVTFNDVQRIVKTGAFMMRAHSDLAQRVLRRGSRLSSTTSEGC